MVPDLPAALALHDLTAARAAQAIRNRLCSPAELVRALVERARALDPRLQAWETLDAEQALASARACSTERSNLPLHGVPFGVKDIFDAAGLATRASFEPFRQRVPSHDAVAVARLKAAGGILLGKTVTTQFAYADPAPTANPWRPGERTPGGSSSGSAAAVAARLVPLALGSQTAGSILRPAAYTGIVGFKPTFGLIPTTGVLPVAWSLDTVGVLARAVDDCALFLAAERHTNALPTFLSQADGPDRAPKLGLVGPLLAIAAPRVRAHVEHVARRLQAAGAVVEEVDFTSAAPLDLLLALHVVTMQVEAATVHHQLLAEHTAAYGPRLRALVEVGRLVPGEAYVHAQRLRRRVGEAVAAAASQFDALLYPTATDLPPGPETTGDFRLQVPASLLGLPAISLPTGVDAEERLPHAIQLVGRHFEDTALLAVARWCEAQLDPMPAPPDDARSAS